MSFLASLRHRQFALLWAGQTVSRLGDNLYGVAMAWWVLQTTGSATAMGIVLTCTFAPMVLFLLVGGVAVDRFPRRKVMLLSDVLSGLVVLLITVLAATGQLHMWHVYVASVVFGTVSAFFEPAYVAMVPTIAPEALLPSANALTSLSGQIVRIGGPVIAAAAIAAGSTTLAFALNSLSFFLSAVCLLLIREPPAEPTPVSADHPPSVLRDIREGFGTVLGMPWLWITILVASLGNVTLSGPLAVALPFLVEQRFAANVGAYGLLQSALAVGSVLAALTLGRRGKPHHRGLLAYLGIVVTGLAALGFGLPLPFVAVALLAVIGGAGTSVFGLIWVNTLQEMVPRDRLGRVSSIDFLGSFALLPVGYTLTGWLADQVGASMVFIIGGALTAAMHALALLHPGVRNVD